MKSKTTIFITLIIIVSLFIGGVAGAVMKDNQIYDDIVESVEFCEDQGQVLRLTIPSDGSTHASCFGELPDVDIILTIGN